MHSFTVNIRISHSSKVMFTVLGFTNPDVNRRGEHHFRGLDNPVLTAKEYINCIMKHDNSSNNVIIIMIMLINVKTPTILDIYEHDKFHAQLS